MAKMLNYVFNHLQAGHKDEAAILISAVHRDGRWHAAPNLISREDQVTLARLHVRLWLQPSDYYRR